jgi:hypothetical protein
MRVQEAQSILGSRELFYECTGKKLAVGVLGKPSVRE